MNDANLEASYRLEQLYLKLNSIYNYLEKMGKDHLILDANELALFRVFAGINLPRKSA